VNEERARFFESEELTSRRTMKKIAGCKKSGVEGLAWAVECGRTRREELTLKSELMAGWWKGGKGQGSVKRGRLAAGGFASVEIVKNV